MSADTPLIDVTVRREDGRPAETLRGEATACPHLAIVPLLYTEPGRVRFSGGWSLTHLPSGRRIPGPDGAGPSDLHLLAERLADLDWSSSDPGAFVGYRDRVVAEIRRLEEAEPAGPDDSEIPETATELIRYLLASYQSWDGKWIELPDDRSRVAAIMAQVDRYGLIWCLASLQRVDPRAADSAAAMLSRAWVCGDSMGEWAWQWAKELDSGQPLTLRGIPSPPPETTLVAPDTEATSSPHPREERSQ